MAEEQYVVGRSYMIAGGYRRRTAEGGWDPPIGKGSAGAKPTPSPDTSDKSDEDKEFAGHEESDRPTLVREGLKRFGDPGKASDFARRAMEWQSKKKKGAKGQAAALTPTPSPTPIRR